VLTELLRALAPYLAWPPVIYTILIGLALWAGLSAVQLGRATAAVRGAFANGRRELGSDPDPVAFAAAYESASSALARNPLLGEGWRGLRQSLIVPSGAGQPVVATTEARRWFDLTGLFRSAGADLRYHAALPGLLVGAGLFVTFLGLAAALSAAGEVVAEGVDQARRNAALRDLLGSASVKFVTSLAGLGLSIGYALFRKGRLKAAEREMAAFLAALQDRLPLKTQAALQAEANAILAKQYADVQRIGSDFFVNLGSTLEREFDAGLQQHIKPLADAIEKLSSGIANQNEDALQTMLRAFLEKLEGAVGESMRGTATTLEALGSRLDGLQGAMDAAAQRMGRAAEDMASRLGRGTEAALGGITEQMGALVRGLREAAEEAGHSNRAAGDDLARRMAETADALTGAVAAFQARLEAGAADGVSRLAAPIEELLRQLRDLAEAQRAAGAESTAALAATIGRTAAALEATASKVAEVLGGGAADASGRLVAATEAMRDDLREVLTRFGATLDDSGKALTRGAEAGGDALRGAAAALGEDVAAGASRLREAAEAAGAALREGGRAAGAGMTEAAGTLRQGSEGLGQRLASLGDASAGLARQAEALDKALRAATAPLSGATTDLRGAAEAAREALGPWRETAQALRGAVDGLLSAAASVEAAQRGAGDLSARLTQASERFGGLDEGLARTLRALQEALVGYQQGIAKFVVDLDQGLSRSVSGLQSIAQGLQDSVEEIGDALPPRRASGR
jgi:ABC-type transporter Mla subunit MlaD